MTQPSLSLVDTDPAELAVDAIVIGLHSQPDEGGALLPAAGAESIAAAFDGKLTSTLALLGATGAPGEVTKLATLGTVSAPLVVAVGLGDEPSGSAPETETLRRGTGAAVRALAGSGTVALALPLPDDADAPGRAARDPGGRAARLVPVRRLQDQAAAGPPRAGVGASRCTCRTPPTPPRAAEVSRAEIVARAVRLTRDWVNTAPNELRPPQFADAVVAAAEGTGLEVEVLDFDAAQGRRVRRHRRGRPGLRGAAAAGQAVLHAGRGRPTRSGWRWSARASPSTPAASASSRPRACGR